MIDPIEAIIAKADHENLDHDDLAIIFHEIGRARKIEDAARDWASEPVSKSDQARSELRLSMALRDNPRMEPIE